MGGNRAFWPMVLISIVAVVILQAVAGTASSPLERWLHIQQVPRYWPFLLAGATGLIGGALLNARSPKAQGGAPQSPSKARGKTVLSETRGRHAVPRHLRRERDRRHRQRERLEAAETRRREQEADAAAAAAAAAAPPPAPPRGPAWLRAVTGVFRRQS